MQVSAPLGMTTLSTHDTKRGEDTRARLGVLSELPARVVARSSTRYAPPRPPLPQRAARRAHRVPALADAGGHVDGRRPDRRGPARGVPDQGDPRGQDPHHVDGPRRAVRGRGARRRATGAGRPDDRRAVLRRGSCGRRAAVRAATLGTKLVQLTLPGIPDVYQGTEVPNPVLVDPDNRRPVDARAAGRPPRPARRRRRPARPRRREAAGHLARAAAAAGRCRRRSSDRQPGSCRWRTRRGTRSPTPGRSPATRASRSSPPGWLPRSTGSAAGPTTRSRCPTATGTTCSPDRPATGRGRRRRTAAGPAARRPARPRRRAEAMLPRVWAPTAARVDVGRRRRVRDADDRGRRLVGRRRRPPARHRLRLLGSTAARRDPTRAARGSRTACTAPSRVFDTATFAWSDAGWAGVDVRGRVYVRAARRHVHARGHPDLRDRAPRPAGRARRRPGRAHAGRPVRAACTAGATTASRLYAVHEPYGGPAALQAFVDAAHAPRPRRLPGRRLQPPRPVRQLPRRVRPVLHRRAPDAVGCRDQPRRTGVRRGPPLGRATARCAGSATSTSTPCAWTPCTRSSTSPHRHVLAQLSDEVAALAAALGRPLSLVAESDLNDPVSVTPTRRRRLGHDRAVGRRRPPRHPRPASPASGTGYYADFGSPEVLRKALTGVFVHDGEMSTFRGRGWGRPVPPGDRRPPRSSSPRPDPRPGRQPRARRPARPPRLDPGRLAVEAALVLLAPFTPDALHGRGVGHAARRGSSSPTTPSPTWPPPCATAARREFGGARLGRALRRRRRGARPAGPRHRSTRQHPRPRPSSTTRRIPSTRACSTGTGP